ncbi:MAG: methyl-accepting chemotaxis protein [Lachnospiraceae bacterium]|nr:methyl-accepting chemotaxis protein [Lachnospiraceae bacterium]
MKNNKKKSSLAIPVYRRLSTKLIASFLVPVICIILLGVISYQRASAAIISNYENSLQETMTMTNQYLTLLVDTVRSNYKSYLSDTDLAAYLKDNMDESQAKKFAVEYTKDLKRETNTNSLVSDLYIISDDVISLTSSAPTTSTLFTAYIQTPEGAQVNDERSSYHLFGNLCDADEALGTHKLNYSLRIAKYIHNCKSILLIDIDRDALSDSLSSLSAGDDSYAALITHDGTEFYSDGNATRNSVFTSSDFYKEVAESEESGMKYVDYNGQKYLFLYSPMYSPKSPQGSMICTLIPESTILAQAAGIKTVAMILVIVAVLIALLLGYLLSAHINSNIYHILGQLQIVSDGDLTVKLQTKSKDEFKLLAGGVNSMTDSMKALITNVTEASDSLNLAAGQVSSASEAFVRTAEDIQNAITEIDTGITQLDSNSEDCLTQMDSLSDKIGTVADGTKDIITMTQHTSSSISEGISSMSVLTDSAKKTSEITDHVIQAIEALSDKSRSIGQIVESINSIAKETNLLSLNASIEAARAGEAGRGFAVVAEQIRKLADQSAQSAGQIQLIIDDIVTTTYKVVDIAKEAESTVEFQEKAVAQTTDAFVTMDSQVHTLLDSISEISDSMQNMEDARTATLNAIAGISAISAETSAGSGNVSQTVNAQRDTIQTLDTAASILQERAAELTNLLRQFTI